MQASRLVGFGLGAGNSQNVFLMTSISSINYFNEVKEESQGQQLKETTAEEKENEDEDPAKTGNCSCVISYS